MILLKIDITFKNFSQFIMSIIENFITKKTHIRFFSRQSKIITAHKTKVLSFW